MSEIASVGSTSVLTEVFISDSSATDGSGLTGLVYNSGSLTAYYHRSDSATATSITLADMTVGTWTSGGFKAIDGTNMPGWYQIGLPDACFASGARSVTIQLKGATNMAPMNLRFVLTASIPDVNVVQISGDSAAADNLETAADGGSYNLGGGGVVAASVTAGVTLENDAITAAKIAADAIGASEIAAGAITDSEAPNLDAAVSSVSGGSGGNKGQN